MGPGILPETTASKHNPACHLQMPNKALSCRKEAICEHGPEVPSCPVGQGSFKIDCFKVEKWSMVRRVTFLLEITEAVSSGLKTFQRVIRYGQLACFGRHYENWRVYKGFKVTFAPLQRTCISAGQCKTTYCSYYNSMLRSRRVRCWFDLPAVEIFHI